MSVIVNGNTYLPSVDGKIYGQYPLGDAPVGEPGITNVTGIISDGETLTISGAAFGSGCANIMFENYENGAVGSQVLSSNTNYDTNNAFVIALRDADSRSGSKSASTYQQHSTVLDYRSAVIEKDFGGDYLEVYTSYAVKVPSGSTFPGNDGGSSGTNADYSSDSSWKQNWFLGPGSTTNDLITATHVGGGIWHTGGNDLGTLRNHGTDPTWWSWGNWNRLSMWVKAGATPNVDAGNLYFQVANTAGVIYEFNDTPVIFANGTAPYRFTKVNAHGWQRERSTLGGVKTLYDDVYIAWGDNAAARVELGNNAVYENCTDLAICDYSSWESGSITVTCREGGLNLAQNTWLFVTLADNTTRYSYQVVTV